MSFTPAKIDDNLRLVCVLCDEKFITNAILNNHVRAYHLRIYDCHVCNNFSTLMKIRLKLHLKLEHKVDQEDEIATIQVEPKIPNEKPLSKSKESQQLKVNENSSFDCGLCKEKFSSEDTLESHIRTFHQRIYSCHLCSKFTTMIRVCLRFHLKLEHNVDQAADTNQATIQDQPKIPNGKPISNSNESQQTATETSAPNNKPGLDMFDEDEPIRRFECEECWFTADTNNELIKHQETKHDNADVLETETNAGELDAVSLEPFAPPNPRSVTSNNFGSVAQGNPELMSLDNYGSKLPDNAESMEAGQSKQDNFGSMEPCNPESMVSDNLGSMEPCNPESMKPGQSKQDNFESREPCNPETIVPPDNLGSMEPCNPESMKPGQSKQDNFESREQCNPETTVPPENLGSMEPCNPESMVLDNLEFMESFTPESTVPSDNLKSMGPFTPESTVPSDNLGSMESFTPESTEPPDNLGSIEPFTPETTVPSDSLGSMEPCNPESTVPPDNLGSIEQFTHESTVPLDNLGSMEPCNPESTVPPDGNLGSMEPCNPESKVTDNPGALALISQETFPPDKSRSRAPNNPEIEIFHAETKALSHDSLDNQTHDLQAHQSGEGSVLKANYVETSIDFSTLDIIRAIENTKPRAYNNDFSFPGIIQTVEITEPVVSHEESTMDVSFQEAQEILGSEDTIFSTECSQAMTEYFATEVYGNCTNINPGVIEARGFQTLDMEVDDVVEEFLAKHFQDHDDHEAKAIAQDVILGIVNGLGQRV